MSVKEIIRSSRAARASQAQEGHRGPARAGRADGGAAGSTAARRAEAAEGAAVVVVGAATTRVAPADGTARVAGVAQGPVASVAGPSSPLSIRRGGHRVVVGIASMR